MTDGQVRDGEIGREDAGAVSAAATAGARRAGGWRSCAATLGFWSGLLLVVVALVVGGLRPEELPVASRLALDPDSFAADAGQAFVADLPQTITEEHRAEAVLLEDGVPLRRDDVHDNIRTQGSRFSLWGEHLWLSSTDGSDPRANGRRYQLLLPRGHLELALRVSVVGLVAGALLLLLGMALDVRLHRVLGGLAVVAVVGLPLWRGVTAVRWGPRLDRAAQGIRAADGIDHPGPPMASLVGEPGNTTHVMAADRSVTFHPSSTLPEAPRPVTFTFAAEGGQSEGDGLVRLQPGEGRLVGRPDGNVAPQDLAEIILRVLAPRAGVLQLAVRGTDPPGSLLSRIDLPFEASDEVQVLRIQDPLSLSLGAHMGSVGELEVAPAPTASAAMVCRVDEAVAMSRWTVFHRSTSGQGAFLVGQEQRQGRWQSVAGSFRVPLGGARGALVKGAVAVLRQGDPGDRLSCRVAWEDPVTGERRPLLETHVSPEDGFVELRAELPAGARDGVLVLSSDDVDAGTVLSWSGWRVVDTSRRPRQVVLALVDTLRADALSSHGSRTSSTPALDRLAAEGVRFERAYSQSYWTRPSMASIMTARYVDATGVHWSSQRLPPSYTTLAEAFAASGFHTVALVSNTNAGPDAGLEQGWAELRLELASYDSPDAGTTLARHVDPRLEHLAEEDLLLYTHFMDVHGPYGPPAAPADWAPPGGSPVTLDSSLDRVWHAAPTDTSRRQLYARGVTAFDRSFGGWLDERWRRWEADGIEGVVAVMSDHGEYLGEYGLWSHVTHDLVPEIVHVPMLLCAPGLLAAGSVVQTPVENIDMAPTLLDLMGLDPAVLGAVDGRSLLPLVREGELAGQGTAIATAAPGAELLSVYDDRGGLLGHGDELIGFLPTDPHTGRPARGRYLRPEELDYGGILEQQALAGTREGFRAVWRALVESGDLTRGALWTPDDSAEVHLDPEALSQLMELGYLR